MRVKASACGFARRSCDWGWHISPEAKSLKHDSWLLVLKQSPDYSIGTRPAHTYTCQEVRLLCSESPIRIAGNVFDWMSTYHGEAGRMRSNDSLNSAETEWCSRTVSNRVLLFEFWMQGGFERGHQILSCFLLGNSRSFVRCNDHVEPEKTKSRKERIVTFDVSCRKKGEHTHTSCSTSRMVNQRWHSHTTPTHFRGAEGAKYILISNRSLELLSMK